MKLNIMLVLLSLNIGRSHGTREEALQQSKDIPTSKVTYIK